METNVLSPYPGAAQGKAGTAMDENLLDSSMLIREWRRWKASGRWKLMLAAGAFCGWLALVLVLNLIVNAKNVAGDSSPERTHAILASLTMAVIVCSSVLAFFQSMQALRREAWSQTLESLFLTLQTDRGVILSILTGGLVAGSAFALLFLPVIVLASVALSVPAAEIAITAAYIAAMLLLGSGLGAAWFFVSAGLVPSTWTLRRGVLDATGVFAVFAAARAAHTLPHDNSEAMASGLLSLAFLCAMAGVVIWATRTLVQESHTELPGQVSAGGQRQRSMAGRVRIVSVILAGLFAVGLALAIAAPAACGIDLRSPASLILPSLAVIGGYGAGADLPQAPAAGLSLLSLLLTLPFLLLTGAGMVAATIRLYRHARQQPELITGTRSAALGTVSVGRDDWRGVGNPVLTRELRTRLRSGDARMFLAISALLSIAAALTPLLAALSDTLQPSQIASIARSSFIAVGLVQLGILCLVGPGIGAEVIAAEREKKTYDMLLASQLSAGEILWGKMLGCLALLTLLISPACPLLALTAILHGVTALSVVLMVAGLLAFALVISVLSVAISALAKSSVTGKWTAYLLAGLLFLFSGWGPYQLAGQDPWALFGGIWLFVVGNIALVFWYSAESRLLGPRRPVRRPAYAPSHAWETAPPRV